MGYIFAGVSGLIFGLIINIYYNFNSRFQPYIEWLLSKNLINLKSGIIEVLMFSGFILVYIKNGFDYEFLNLCFLYIFLLLASLEDLKSKTIPNRVIIIGMAFAVAIIIIRFSVPHLINSLLSAAISFAVLFLLSVITKGEIGMGDVKLTAVAALFLGFSNLLSVFTLSLIACTIFGIFLIIFKKASRKSTLPFAPFLLAGLVCFLII